MAEQDQRRSFTILWNASSGWDEGEQALETVEKALQAHGKSVKVQQVKKGMDICDESRTLAQSKPDVLVAAGGDGTLNAAASALIHQQSALGVIPAGTLNHFARDLKIPLELEAATDLLLSGKKASIDIATVNGRVFINNAVLGLFPNYRAIREAWEQRGWGRSRIGRGIAMAAGILGVFWRLPHLSVHIGTGGQTRHMFTPFVLVGNNEHQMESFALGKRLRMDKGDLWVYVMRPCSRWKLLRMLVALLLKRTSRKSVFQIYQTSQFTVESERKFLNVGVDGEIVQMNLPLEFQSLPRALRVIVPSSYQASVEIAAQ